MPSGNARNGQRLEAAGTAEHHPGIFPQLRKEIAALEREVDGSKASVQRQLELAKKLQEFEALQQTVKNLEDEIAVIPPEIRKKYKTKTERKETIALE